MASAPSCSLTATCRTASHSCPTSPPGGFLASFPALQVYAVHPPITKRYHTWYSCQIRAGTHQVHVLVERIRVSSQVPHAVFSLEWRVKMVIVPIGLKVKLNLFIKSLDASRQKAMDAKGLPLLQGEGHPLEPLRVPDQSFLLTYPWFNCLTYLR